MKRNLISLMTGQLSPGFASKFLPYLPYEKHIYHKKSLPAPILEILRMKVARPNYPIVLIISKIVINIPSGNA